MWCSGNTLGFGPRASGSIPDRASKFNSIMEKVEVFKLSDGSLVESEEEALSKEKSLKHRDVISELCYNQFAGVLTVEGIESVVNVLITYKNQFLEALGGDEGFVGADVANLAVSLGYDGVMSRHLVQKWLRDEKRIYVTVDHCVYDDSGRFTAQVSGYGKKEIFMNVLMDGFTLFDTYEEALEEGLVAVLKYLFDNRVK